MEPSSIGWSLPDRGFTQNRAHAPEGQYESWCAVARWAAPGHPTLIPVSRVEQPLAPDGEGPWAALRPGVLLAGLTATAHQSSGALPTPAIGRPLLVRPQCGSFIEVSCPPGRTQIRPQRPCLPAPTPPGRAASPSATAYGRSGPGTAGGGRRAPCRAPSPTPPTRPAPPAPQGDARPPVRVRGLEDQQEVPAPFAVVSGGHGP